MSEYDWYNIGNMPPVGKKVKVVAKAIELDTLSRFSGLECLVVSHFSTGDRAGFVLSHPTRGVGAFLHVAGDVEPVKSDRDKAIESLSRVVEDEHSLAFGGNENKFLSIAKAIYDAGWRPKSD